MLLPGDVVSDWCYCFFLLFRSGVIVFLTLVIFLLCDGVSAWCFLLPGNVSTLMVFLPGVFFCLVMFLLCDGVSAWSCCFCLVLFWLMFLFLPSAIVVSF